VKCWLDKARAIGFALLLSAAAISIAGCSKSASQSSSVQAPSFNVKALQSHGKELATRMGEMDQKQKYWMEQRVPNELGEARMQLILADSAGFAEYRELDERQTTIVNAHRQSYFEYASLVAEAEALLLLQARLTEGKQAEELQLQLRRHQQRLEELKQKEQELYDAYTLWESAMSGFLLKWKQPKAGRPAARPLP